MADLTSRLLVKLVDGVSGPARGASAALRKLNNSARGVNGGGALVAMQERIGKAAERNNRAIEALQGRLVMAGAGAYALQRSMASVVGPAVSFESAMADVAKVSDFDDKGLAAFGKQLRKLATSEIPLAVNELAALAANAAQAGVSDVDLEGFTRLTAKAATAWEMGGAAAGESLAKLRSALGLTNEQTGLFADAINHLSDNTASSAGDLVDYARRVAAQGEFFGFAKEESLAFGAAMVGSGAQADVAATSFRNMGRALTRGASATKAQRRAYHALGLDAAKVAQSMQQDATATTLDVMERIGRLPEHLQASAMSDLFGDEARALAPLLGRLDILRDALKLVAEEQDYANSVGREFERRAATTAQRWQIFKNQIGDIALALSGSLLPALKSVMGTLGPIALRLADFVEANSKFIVGIGAVTAGLIALNVAGIAAGIGARFAYGGVLMLAKGALGLMKPVAWLAGSVATSALGFFQTLNMRAKLAGKPGLFSRIADGFTVLARSAGRLVHPRNIIRGLFALGPKGWLLAGALGAAAVAAKNFTKIKSAGKGFWAGFAENLKLPEGGIEALNNALSKLSNLIPTLGGDDKSFEEWGKGWGKYAAEGVNTLIGHFQTVAGWISKLISLANDAASAISSIWSSGTSVPSGPPVAGNPVPAQKRARGGHVSRGGSYLVGEHRPEIFTPGQSGYVMPRLPEGRSSPPAVTNNITVAVHGVGGDLDEIAAKVSKKIAEVQRALFRGVQTDLGHIY